MTQTILKSSKDWLVVGIVATAAFGYFTAGAVLLSRISDGIGPQTGGALLVRGALAIVVAAAMLVSERRKEHPSIDAATRDGILIAAIVIIVDNLGGVSEGGAVLGIRTALILIGLPLLAILTHLLARPSRGQPAPQLS